MLVVEDASRRSLKLVKELGRDGNATDGPYHSVLRALGGIPDEEIDVVVLAIDLRGELIFPLVDELTEQACRSFSWRIRTCASFSASIGSSMR